MTDNSEMDDRKPGQFRFPVVFRLDGRPCLVVGGGTVATRKVCGLLRAGAKVTVISPETTAEIERLAAEGQVRLFRRHYNTGDVQGYTLLFGAFSDDDLSRQLAEEARESGVPINLADDPDYCDFILPSCLRRGDLTVAVSTSGKSPALARRLRLKLEKELGHEYAVYTDALGKVRSMLMERLPDDTAKRREILLKIIDSDLLSWLQLGQTDRFWRQVEQLLDDAVTGGGRGR